MGIITSRGTGKSTLCTRVMIFVSCSASAGEEYFGGDGFWCRLSAGNVCDKLVCFKGTMYVKFCSSILCG